MIHIIFFSKILKPTGNATASVQARPVSSCRTPGVRPHPHGPRCRGLWFSKLPTVLTPGLLSDCTG